MDFWMATGIVLGGAGVLAVLLKPSIEKIVRRMDAPVGQEHLPILKRIKLPLHGSHRGGAKSWPENTLLAFKGAADVPYGSSSNSKELDQVNPLPCRMIELDVQQSKDGHLVVIHNLTLEQVTDGSGQVCDHSLEQLRALDAAYQFTQDGGCTFPYRGTGVKIPLLSEALELIASREDLIVYLDFKTPDCIAPALEVARKCGLLDDRTVVGAVPPEANKELLKLKPRHVPATPDISSMIHMYVCYCLGLLWLVPMRHELVGTTAYRWGYKVLTKHMVEAFHARGRLMAVFGDYIDMPEGQIDCLSMQCDILMSDKPDVLWRTMQEILSPPK